MFINPKDCIHYNVCKFAEDAACFEGCDYRKERTTSDNSNYAKCNQCKDYYSDMSTGINFCPHCGSELKKHFA